MCLVTPPSASSPANTRTKERSNNNRNDDDKKKSKMPRKTRSRAAASSPAQLRQMHGIPVAPSSKEHKPSASPKKRSAKATKHGSVFWFFVLAGCFWTVYTLLRVLGREEFAHFQSGMEKETKFLSQYFRRTAAAALDGGGSDTAGAKLVSAAAVMVEGAVTQQQQQPQEVSYQRTLKEPSISQSAAIGPPVAFQAKAASQYKVDFSQSNPQRNHAIMIPYRDRKFHLEQFIEHMGPYLKRNFPHDSFELWIIEQDDAFLFNRAWLGNVGVTSIKYQNKLYKYQKLQQQQHSGGPITVPPPPTCIILHDVDLIPTVDGVPYTNCSRPMQLGSELAHFNNSIPYPLYTGGVGPSMLLDHWIKINGMSNDFFGWGGEDDELWHRLRLTGLLKKPVKRPTPTPAPNGKPYKGPKFWPPEIVRPPKGKGRFRPISEAQTVHHNQKEHNQWTRIGHMLELMQNNSARWKQDGLSDLRMTVTGDAMTVTHMDSIAFTNHSVPTDPSIAATTQSSTTTITRKHYPTAKRQGSVISSLSIEPAALASFAAIHHIRAIPKLTALEFIHVTQTDGGRIERAGAKAGIAWGACHYHHALEEKMGCPDKDDPEWEGRVKQRKSRAGHTPWHSPLQDFEENPYRGRPTFAVVRHPYDRLIDFFYCPWNGFKGEKTPSAADLNAFLQNAMFPPPIPAEDDGTKNKKTKAPKRPTPAAFSHLRPLSHYVFAHDEIHLYSKPFVTHMVHYENLEQEFRTLMQQYGLQNAVMLPTKTPSGSKYIKTLTPHDFFPKTLEMIHKFYAGDFDRFNYDRALPSKRAQDLEQDAVQELAQKNEQQEQEPAPVQNDAPGIDMQQVRMQQGDMMGRMNMMGIKDPAEILQGA
ncbi:Beta-1,4-galactosyltransferase 3 [Seminavis robusta]|uniref:Beta-1,4-galactosyltransferase 3 n=1 Tax=Seminavis robusta TaxID=568900 RepID=A0A9N8DRU5_9STRA|nr:Beta-1,4-galactosyltransferase 3 [Seminavis robusta]|eukprot:Sro237_g095230.1 Beta-1,4-galactosyltransferase 3 (868) ;mRNA; f:25194-27990